MLAIIFLCWVNADDNTVGAGGQPRGASSEINATEAGTTSPGVSLNCARRLDRLVRPL